MTLAEIDEQLRSIHAQIAGDFLVQKLPNSDAAIAAIRLARLIRDIEPEHSEPSPESIDTEGMTDRQLAIYRFIRAKIVQRNYGPTVREIGTEFDIKSPNGVMCHLKALQRKGLITRAANMSRAITLCERLPA